MSRTGRDAEDAALAFLERSGLKLVQRNYRCRFGEIDLVMRDGRVLVFVEVRYRASAAFGGAAASITPRKQGRLLAAARHFLASHADALPCRLDAVLLNGDGRIEWIKNAFGE
ncbi:MAG: YraN family protein [Burkholderiales bacterium]